VIDVGDAPAPRPGAGEVLIRVHAAGVTPTELLWAPTWTTRDGSPRPFPVIPGHEFSGEIAEVGAGVTDLAVGEPGYGMSDWFADGAQAEFCTAPAAWVGPKPRSLEHTAAAVVPISALTAWQGLFVRCGLTAGQHVLIHGGAGAVGLFAVQLARWKGARVTATASAHNLDFVRGLGADEVLDYRATRFEDIVAGVDAVFDTVGGETLARSWDVLRPGGRLVTVASSGEGTADERTRGAFFIVEANRPQLSEVARLIDGGALRPVVDGVFPIAEARAAYAHKPRRGKAALQVVSHHPTEEKT
jgi:NADPH:quinone reductase-like Zn-dependent oxidoreductase